ncbi:tyrosine-protein phosphatase non-receptor type 18 [Pempheris klunzingeri]|uniref:tyrosine-protein phosphatase non-receptor type 18 n=1 Tax=Pempheris klunzingeri TaxID=3127111 RepID=UPI00397EE510
MELLPSLLSTLRSVDPGTLDQEYSAVRSQTSVLKRDLCLTTEAGALKENIKKNRYKDILPYDQSRVLLSPLSSDSDSDYINASFIRGASSDHRYIASQAPLNSTVTHFWGMIWEHKVKVIVMACREIEMGKKKSECYWAPVHQLAAFGPFTVYTQGETRPNEDLVVRALTVSHQQDSHSLIQYQFLSWPDHDIPYEASGVLDLLERVRSSEGGHTSPLLIHCSAGCGRTGVICALDYIHDLLVTKKITADFSIMKIVLELRSQRPSAVQTKEQYQFIFTAAALMFERVLRSAERPPRHNQSKPKKPEKKTRPVSSINRPPQETDMSDTYAVVNKPKHHNPPSPSSAHSGVATPGSSSQSRMLPPSHHYDNDPSGVPAVPIYSTVSPRVKPLSLTHSATPIYDMATPASHNGEYNLLPADCPSPADDEYEDLSSSVSDVTNLCSPGGIGFNCRIQKPRGPRDPPAEWSRLER